MKKLTFAESYIGQLRSKIGHDRVFVPAARAVILNRQDEVLLVRRSDDGKWALASGLPEVGESAVDCLRREVWEETGLELEAYACFGISSEAAAEVHTYPNGDEVHAYALLFFSREFRGEPRVNDDETLAVRWFDFDRLPQASEMSTPDRVTLELFREFQKSGEFQLR